MAKYLARTCRKCNDYLGIVNPSSKAESDNPCDQRTMSEVRLSPRVDPHRVISRVLPGEKFTPILELFLTVWTSQSHSIDRNK
jgi:hypothetical protein